MCSPLRWSFSGLNGTSVLIFWGSLRASAQNKMVALTQTRHIFLFSFGVVLIYFCRSEERKTCPVWEDPLLPSTFKTRCFFSWKKAKERTPSYLPVFTANFKIPNKGGCSWISVSHSEKFSEDLFLLTREPLWENSKTYKAFEENHTNWTGWF